MALTYRIETRDEWELVSLNGHINEDAEVALAELSQKISAKCVFNLRDIASINSCGVRAWINFIRDIEKSRAIVFEECTPEIVSQINMIPNFRGKSVVRSVYSSYVCDSCGHQKLELFKAGENLPKSAEAEIPEVRCPKCNEVMDMEELQEEFFAWLEP